MNTRTRMSSWPTGGATAGRGISATVRHRGGNPHGAMRRHHPRTGTRPDGHHAVRCIHQLVAVVKVRRDDVARGVADACCQVRVYEEVDVNGGAADERRAHEDEDATHTFVLRVPARFDVACTRLWCSGTRRAADAYASLRGRYAGGPKHCSVPRWRAHRDLDRARIGFPYGVPVARRSCSALLRPRSIESSSQGGFRRFRRETSVARRPRCVAGLAC